MRHRVAIPTSTLLIAACMISNFVAFAASVGLNEQNPLVRPGNILSLAETEGVILLASLFITSFVRRDSERLLLQSLLVGYLTADAVNDIVAVITRDMLVATQMAWLAAAAPPVLTGLLFLRRGEAPGNLTKSER